MAVKSPTSIHEIILAMSNMSAAYFQCFPWDYTLLVLMLVAINLNFFSLIKNEQTRVQVFEDFINQVLKEMRKDISGHQKPIERKVNLLLWYGSLG